MRERARASERASGWVGGWVSEWVGCLFIMRKYGSSLILPCIGMI